LAIDGEQVVFFGGYEADRDRLVIGSLGDTAIEDLQERRLVLPDGAELPNGVTVFGRGSELHVIANDEWYRLAVEDIPTR
jgi:hypothetical protein